MVVVIELRKYDLGGLGKKSGEYITVNLSANSDIQKDITELDSFCADNSVDGFRMIHTLEHIDPLLHDKFFKGIYRKLKVGGKLVVVQTDIKRVMMMFCEGKLDFYALRHIILGPISIQRKGFEETQRNVQLHRWMWGEEELAEELKLYGFSKVRIFDAGHWNFDFPKDLPFETDDKYQGLPIPNLGVEAIK